MIKILTLCIIQKDGKVLLGMKKRGFGEGKWNGFGGKVQDGETIEDAAKRELFEEAGISADDLQKLGVLDFSWEAKPKEILQVHIFKAAEFSGEPTEGEEMKPQWFGVSQIPFEKMWSSDEYWFPLFLEGKEFKGKFIFNERNEVLKYEL
jgi:8-oxo-dGTP pyrophosphatase MutT (NUDIX family)